ncbi:uncharacterized protein LOC115308493 [Ixodes scapularis]|uniref:uncharacterized protein LOC115308493 n=1 Tax=Ixodes scapularis TaxID=6945 RepID=UPI001A9CFFF2|nr:uncharacterized protein LOC115308493 [Ixodes scapularis]
MDENVLQPLLQDLAELKSNGLQVRCGEGTMTVKATVAAVCGDNLSLNKLGGFSCCFSSGRVCRFCMATKARLAELTREELCVIRSANRHSIHLSAIAINPSLKKQYGVTGPSPMLSLEDFDVTKQLMPDIMHDMFEGGFAVVLHYVLQGLIQEGTLALSDLEKVAKFKFGFNDRKNKPEPLSVNFTKDHRALRGTASQKWCLFRLLPLMMASSIPEGNAHWELYLKYREITDMILAPEVPTDFVPYLEDRIQGFLKDFSETYPSASVPPKLHYLVHYPRIIREYGPLQQYWCMRFEAKHQYFKGLALKTKNFLNITKTLSTRHQLLQSYELHTFVLDKPVYATGLKVVAPAELNQCAESLASDGLQVWEAKSIETSTGVYQTNDVLLMNKTMSLSFAKVSTVYMVNREVFLLLNELQVERFRRHRCSYRVQNTDNFYLKQPGEEACFQRLDLYNEGELVPKWDSFYYP